jgi:hypothetical protein
VSNLVLIKSPKPSKPKKTKAKRKPEDAVVSVLDFAKKDAKDIATIVVVAVSHDDRVYTLSSGLDTAEKTFMLQRAINKLVQKADKEGAE